MTFDILRNALIALALVATAAPLAAASHNVCASVDQSSTCIDAGSSAYGSCDDTRGSESTGVILRRYAWGDGTYSYEETSVSASCYTYSWEYDGERHSGESNGVYVQRMAYDEDGSEHTWIAWYAHESNGPWGTFGGCDTQVLMDGELQSYGCPAGSPPRVPALLP